MKKWWLIGGGIAVVIIATAVVLVKTHNRNATGATGAQGTTTSQRQSGSDLGDANSTDPIERGKALSNGLCTGTGSKPLTSPPMNPTDVSYVVPYGLLAGGHVTPIDHQYYWGTVPMGNPDSYNVLAPADGTLVDMSYRPHPDGSKVKGDYRAVISYSCTFFSYFDLATSLAPDIESQLPSGWETQSDHHTNINIKVKAGQVIAKMGGQSLDYAVWDTTKTLAHLTVPVAFNNAEPWKINTVPPLDYYTDTVKNEVLPLYLRSAEPRDGVIDQDVEGAAAGSWFLQGTNGYAGAFDHGESAQGYWSGHLALVHDLYDPTSWVFSIGSYNGGEAKQFGMKSPSPSPDQLTTKSGVVKYELGEWQHVDDTGNTWTGEVAPKGAIKFKAGPTQATALVQLVAAHQLKIEVFPGKTPTQVSDFDSNAKTYDRGDNAKMISSDTAH